MKKLTSVIMVCALVPVYVSSATAQTTTGENEKISAIFAFGDSYTDNGASFRFSDQMVKDSVTDAYVLPGDLYWQNRWSNGPTSVEVLAEKLQLELTDYAVGGAKSDQGNYYHWMDDSEKTGALGQIETFKMEQEGKEIDANALYFVFISANDYFEFIDYGLSGTIEELTDKVANNINMAVESLADLGAKRIFVVSSTDLSILPAVTAESNESSATDFQTQLNEDLLESMEMLSSEADLDITYFDHIALSDEIRSNAESFGLKNIADACQPVYPEVKPVCASPDEYYFWDEWHPTRRVHEIVAEEMFAAINQ